jgi:hypothetical protein
LTEVSASATLSAVKPLLLAILVVLGCQERSTPPEPSGPTPVPAAERPSPRTDAGDQRDACLDSKLWEAHLNSYGDPEGTAYAGGTPLFNEATGQAMTRREYVAKRHPELAASCPTNSAKTP